MERSAQIPETNLITAGTTRTLGANGRQKPSDDSLDWDIMLGNGYAHYGGSYGRSDQGFSVRISGSDITITVPADAMEALNWEARTAAGVSVTFGIEKPV